MKVLFSYGCSYHGGARVSKVAALDSAVSSLLALITRGYRHATMAPSDCGYITMYIPVHVSRIRDK